MNQTTESGDRYQLPPLENGNSPEQSNLQTSSYHTGHDRSNNANRLMINDDVAVRYRSCGKSYVVGKIMHTGSQWVFFSRVKDRDLLRTLDAWSIPPEVVDLLEQVGVSGVHYLHVRTSLLYTIDIATIRQRGILRTMDASIGQRYHVPRAYWHITAVTYEIPFVEAEIEVVARSLPKPASLFDEAAR